MTDDFLSAERLTLQDVLAAWGATVGSERIKKRGREYHGPCPICARQTDGCWLHDRSGTVVFQCRCRAKFPDLLAAVGLIPSMLTRGPRIEPKLSTPVSTLSAALTGGPSVPARALVVDFPDGDPIQRDNYRCMGPNGEREKEIVGHGKSKHVRWAGDDGPKPRRLVYLPSGTRPQTGPVFVCEGERDADAAVRLGLVAFGTCTGATSCPDSDTLKWVLADVTDPTVNLWPDADAVGREHMQAVGAAFVAAGVPAARLRVLDPETLGLTQHGSGAADFEALHSKEADPMPITDALDAAARLWTDKGAVPNGWVWLSDVSETAEDGPPVVARGLAWAGRVTLLHAREKVGKSTLVGAAVAAITCGTPFLAQPTREGPVLWFGEEHYADAKKRLTQWGADCGRVLFGNRIDSNPDDPASLLPSLITKVKPVCVVIDTLTMLAGQMGIRDLNTAGDLGPMLADVVSLVRESNCSMVILHHNRKNPSSSATTGDATGEYRDSTSIGAAVDQLVALSHVSGDLNARRLTIKGRWVEPSYVVTLGANGFTLHPDGGNAPEAPTPATAVRPLADRVLLHLLRCPAEARPGTTALASALNCQGRRYKELPSTVDALVDDGLIDHAQRPGTTGRRQSGFALTPEGRLAAENLRRGSGSGVPGMGVETGKSN